MDQQSTNLQYKVGLFLGVGLLAFMVMVLALGGDKMFFTRYVDLHVRFDEVQGLFPGSVVSLAGMPVGNIKTITFVPKTSQLDIAMKIDEVFRERLVEGTVAEIRTQGALGDKYIYLTPGPHDAKPLENHAVVKGEDTDYMKLLTDRQDGVARVIDLIKEMQALVASINANGKASELMRNAADASAHLKSTMVQLDGLLGDVRAQIPENKKLKNALISLSSVMEKIDHGNGTLGQLINDPTLYQNLKNYVGGSPRNKYMKDMIRETIQKSAE